MRGSRDVRRATLGGVERWRDGGRGRPRGWSRGVGDPDPGELDESLAEFMARAPAEALAVGGRGPAGLEGEGARPALGREQGVVIEHDELPAQKLAELDTTAGVRSAAGRGDLDAP